TPNLNTWSDPSFAINSPQKKPENGPLPQLISQGGGTYSFNYRNEPLDNTSVVPSPYTGRVGGTKDAADFSYAFASIEREEPWNNVKPPESPVTRKVAPPLFNRPKDPA